MTDHDPAALHFLTDDRGVVSRYYGNDVAAATAEYMEYSGEAWRTS